MEKNNGGKCNLVKPLDSESIKLEELKLDLNIKFLYDFQLIFFSGYQLSR